MILLSFIRTRCLTLSNILIKDIIRKLLKLIGLASLVARSPGVDISFLKYTLVAPIASLIGLIPITISGFGTRDVVFIRIMNQFGIASSTTFALSLPAYFVNAIIPASIGFIIFIFLKRRLSLVSLRRVKW